MNMRSLSFAACAALFAAPLAAQPAEPEQAGPEQAGPEQDGAVNLDLIDSLFRRDDAVTGGEEAPAEDAAADEGPAVEAEALAEEEAPAGPAEEEAATDEPVEEVAEEEAAEDAAAEEEASEPSDLDRAYAGYSACVAEAGAAAEQAGYAIETVGGEALLRCAGQRAAYVNAFYFSLLPRYPDATEAEVRESADRLVAQTDAFLSRQVTAEARAARAAPREQPTTDESGEEPGDAAPADEDASE